MTIQNPDHSGTFDTSIASSATEQPDQNTPFASSTIMMVDDEPTTIDVLEMFLRGEGYENFVTTTDSPNAVALARRERPDILLLDLMMPEVGGLEILREIRNDKELKHLPIIILTSSTEPELKLEALELGATDLLAKPVDPSELALRLKNTLTAKRYQDQLTYYDALTGLPNRRLFAEQLERTLQRASRTSADCALLHINLDRFKQINDVLGHKRGDILLQEVAKRLGRSIRVTDSLGSSGVSEANNPLSRVGGDEFSVLLPGMGKVDLASRVARRILKDLSTPFDLDGNATFVTASIGISFYPNDGDNAETLLGSAVSATSHAKKRGCSNFEFYDPSLNLEAAERLKLENQLRQAVENKEIRVYYQPKVEINSRKIIGAEALMRWEHPELGFVGPDQFIPIAEEAGLIGALGEWILRTSCMQNQAWQSAGLPPISIAVNVSAMQFQGEGFVEVVANSLRASQMDPKYLVLELTESVIMENPDETVTMLNAIKEMGVRISVDDFGTGYSSFSSLKRFPIDELKIDRSFVQNIPDDKDDAAIANAIVLIAHTLGLTVVAEGVETEAQLEFLGGCGCDTYQGYLCSRPLPPEQFQRLLSGAI